MELVAVAKLQNTSHGTSVSSIARLTPTAICAVFVAVFKGIVPTVIHEVPSNFLTVGVSEAPSPKAI